MTEFDAFWAIYPRKCAKGDARKAWNQTASIRPDMDTLIAAVKAQCKSEQWRRDGGTYIPYPASWLRAERWDDEVEVVLPKPEKVRDRFDIANERFAAAQATITAEERAKVSARFATLKGMP